MSTKALRNYTKIGAASLTLILAVLFFSNLPNSQLNYGRQLEYQAVYKTYDVTHVLLARPGSDKNFPDPKVSPQDHKNLGRGGVLDDPGIYLLPFLSVPLHIHDPLLALNWAMMTLGICTVAILITRFFRRSITLNRTLYFLPILPGLLESRKFVPFASSWGVTPSNYSLVGQLSLLVLLFTWVSVTSTKWITKILSAIAIGVFLYLLILTRRSAGLEIAMVALMLVTFLSTNTKRNLEVEIAPPRSKWRKVKLSNYWPTLALLGIIILSNSLGGLTVSAARSTSASHLTYSEGASSHSFWGVIYTGLGWKPINNGSGLSSLGVVWSDTWVEQRLHSLAPQIAADNPLREVVAKKEVERIIKNHPVNFTLMMLEKFIFALWMCRWWLLVLIITIFVAEKSNKIKNRRSQINIAKISKTKKNKSKVQFVKTEIPHVRIVFIVILGVFILVSDSLLGAPYQGYLTSENAWFSFWTFYYIHQYTHTGVGATTKIK